MTSSKGIPTQVTYAAVNQHGRVRLLITKFPRKELLSLLDANHADKMYVDSPEGKPLHVGYVIRDEWWSLYKVSGRGV